jgi:hypothetical protein
LLAARGEVEEEFAVEWEACGGGVEEYLYSAVNV